MQVKYNDKSVSIFSSVNGKGKTTIISHIVDAMHEIAKLGFPQSYEDKENKLYRLSSSIYSLDNSKTSIAYLRFQCDKEFVDYLDIRGICSESEYNEFINLENKIPYSQFQSQLSSNYYQRTLSTNCNKEKSKEILKNNILTYFPSYRFEQPGYLNDIYKVNLDFNKYLNYSGFLKNPIEVISCIPQIANWLMDIVLDMQYIKSNTPNIKANIEKVLTLSLISKGNGQLRIGIGPRGFGGTRLQIVKVPAETTLYPSIFDLSSGEFALISIFIEILRQCDNINSEFSCSNMTGIVLIDEIDKHLHIRLQKEILPQLFQLFPNIQFIITSHSPFLSLGLSEQLPNNSVIIDLDNEGIRTHYYETELFEEVYNMLITENNRFKEKLDLIRSRIDIENPIQIISEGKNIEHIRKAITILSPDLDEKITFINGSEDKSGDQQLKNAFEILSCTNNKLKFLFIWDCDSQKLTSSISEKNNHYKYCFTFNTANLKINKGIENLYSEDLFSSEMYDTREIEIDYGGKKTEVVFNKAKFLKKIFAINDPLVFSNYIPLITKIRQILVSN
jgi:predicted ATP-binding protein involved in virulence